MTVFEKMNALIGSSATKEQIKNWAYMNRIMVLSVDSEPEFESMKKTIEQFFLESEHQGKLTEFQLWDMFLDYKFIE